MRQEHLGEVFAEVQHATRLDPVIPIIFASLVALLAAPKADGQTNNCNNTIIAGPLPAGPSLYIPNHDNNSVSIVGLGVPGLPCTTLNPIVQATPRHGAGPTAIAGDPFGAALYVANSDNSASTTDPFAVVSPILMGAGAAIPVGSGQAAIALNPVLPFVYVVNQFGEEPHITAINTTMLTPGTPPPPAATTQYVTEISPRAIAVTADGTQGWVTHSGTNHVIVLDFPAGTIGHTIDVGKQTCGIAILPPGAAALGIVPSAYVTVPAANEVDIIDTATYALVGTIPVGNSPCDITMNAAGTMAYVANFGGSTVSVIGTATGTVIAVIPVGPNPLSLKIDAATGNLIVLNASIEAGTTISIFSGTTFALIAQINDVVYNSVPALSQTSLKPALSSASSSAGLGIDTGRSGDGGAEPTLYYPQADGSISAFGLYTSAPKPSLPASYFMFPVPGPPNSDGEREYAYDPFNQLIWYSTYTGNNDQIRAVDPKTGNPGPVVITGLGCVDEFVAKQNSCTVPNAQWDRHVFVDYAGKRLMTPNYDGSVSLYDLATGSPSTTIPASFFPDTSLFAPGELYLRHFASDVRTGNVWYASADGSFLEMATAPAIKFTGRVILKASQLPGTQASPYRRHFVIDSKRNQLMYEPLGGLGNIGLASIDLTTLQGADYLMTQDAFVGHPATDFPYLTISLVNAGQCQLTLSAQPSLGGQIVTSPAGNPAGYFDCNSTITVTAVPNPGYQLGSFAGDLTGSTSQQTLTMSQARSVTANFTSALPVTVSVSATPSTLQAGQTSQLTASVSNSWKKTVTWSLDSGPGSMSVNGLYSAPAQIAAPQDVVVRATSTADPTSFGTATIHLQLQGTAITIMTSPVGLQFTVDNGSALMAPQTLNLQPGSHTIAVATQPGAAGTQYVFKSWSDGLLDSHTITVTATPATYTATFTTQYQLAISASPAAGGTVSPVSGTFYDAGTAAAITATANTGYMFNGWSGTVANANNASTTVTMSAPQSVTANFTATGHPAFFGGESFLSGTAYYLQFSNTNLFGYYEYLSNSILYHFDLGFEAFRSIQWRPDLLL